MLLFRWLLLILLLLAGVCFAYYVATRQARFKRYGWIILKWTLLAALGFFAVLFVERMA
jgi:hypothetical protein